MKTILFIDKSDSEVWNSYLRYDFVLDEYHEAQAFKVCAWNPAARSVAAAVPGLGRLVGDEQVWQAVVVCDLRSSAPPVQDDVHYDNPFDFEDSYGRKPGDLLEESAHGLVRLTQMLGGLPEQTAMRWPEKREGEAFELGSYEVEYLQGRDRYDLIERYRSNVARPQRILCITPRDVDYDIMKMRERDLSGNQEIAQDGILGFWERNGYPATARFVVCDRQAKAKLADGEEIPKADVDGPQEEGEERRDDWFAFWMFVLTLITAEVQPSYLGAFHVYRGGVEIDEAELNEVFSRRYSEWAMTREQIAAEIAGEYELLRASEYKMTEMPDCTSAISVDFDLVDESKLMADTSAVGFIRDVPENDHKVWRRQHHSIMDVFSLLLRAPRRAVLNAAAHFRTDGRLEPGEIEYCILNEYQREQLEDDLEEQEFELARDVNKKAFSFENYRKEFGEESARIHTEIDRRSSKRHTLLVLGTGIMALIVGFLPYIFGVGENFGSNLLAGIVTLACCAILGGVTLLTLRRMRRDVQDAYRGFNKSMNSVRRSMRDEAGRLSERISSYATFRKKWELLDRQHRIGEPTARTLWLGERDALLRTRIDDIRRISPSCGLDAATCQEMVEGGWERASTLLSRKSFFSVCTPCQTLRHLNEFMPSETDIVVPYSFIARVELTQLELN